MLAIIMAIEDEDDRSFVETIFNKYAENVNTAARAALARSFSRRLTEF